MAGEPSAPTSGRFDDPGGGTFEEERKRALDVRGGGKPPDPKRPASDVAPDSGIGRRFSLEGLGMVLKSSPGVTKTGETAEAEVEGVPYADNAGDDFIAAALLLTKGDPSLGRLARNLDMKRLKLPGDRSLCGVTSM